jgi:hypothetical protein
MRPRGTSISPLLFTLIHRHFALRRLGLALLSLLSSILNCNNEDLSTIQHCFTCFAVIAIPTPQDSAETVGQLSELIGQIKDSQLEALEAENAALVKRDGTPSCTLSNLAIRRE